MTCMLHHSAEEVKDFEKAYERLDKEAFWSVLKIYGVGGQLLNGIQ